MKKKLIGFLFFCILLCSIGTVSFGAEKAEYPYYVTVNLTDNIVTVYEQDKTGAYTEPVKAFLCSGGGYTPEGTFRTTAKYEWRPLFGNVWGQYATRITGHILFHSVPYFEKDKSTLEYAEYNKLGTTASAGCIRLSAADAKWIYDNCPVGTTVKMYRGNVKEPLQPAAAQKLDVNDVERRGWDPTDPDPANPWRKGELRRMQVNASGLNKMTEVYYETGTYYISSADAAELFACIDIKAELPSRLPGKDEVMVFNEKGSHFLNCRTMDDKVYYKIRDVATMTDTEMTWNGEAKQIGIVNGEKTVTLTRIQPGETAGDLPEKNGSVFQS